MPFGAASRRHLALAGGTLFPPRGFRAEYSGDCAPAIDPAQLVKPARSDQHRPGPGILEAVFESPDVSGGMRARLRDVRAFHPKALCRGMLVGSARSREKSYVTHSWVRRRETRSRWHSVRSPAPAGAPLVRGSDPTAAVGGRHSMSASSLRVDRADRPSAGCVRRHPRHRTARRHSQRRCIARNRPRAFRRPAYQTHGCGLALSTFGVSGIPSSFASSGLLARLIRTQAK